MTLQLKRELVVVPFGWAPQKSHVFFGMALYVVDSLIQKNRRLFFPSFLVHTVLISTSSAAETISMRVCISGSRSR